MLENKKRHGCLTVYLAVIVIANLATLLIYGLSSETVKELMPNLPGWVNIASMVFSLTNLICAIALFKWRKWGFWGLLIPTIIMTGVNFSIGIDTGTAIFGLVGVAILYGVLHLGKDNNGWKQLD
ncbi:MAG: hypothetical protein HY885_02560 [Deltaproteobacteria bacterium]|nr:hypothetical protein [Deltaproteobacteria bacterium]